MKKIIFILIAMFWFGISANAIVLRGTHKVCSRNGGELTLYSTGKAVLWIDGQSIDATYNIDNGYLNLFQDGERVFSFKYFFDDKTQQLYWVDVTIRGETQRMSKSNCN